MPDTKITALTAISTVNPATYPLPIVDTADTTMAASGTTKKITVNQILGAGGTATLASATITGDLTVDTSTLKVDSANNKVGILTATPGYPFHVNGTDTTNVLFNGLTKGIRFVATASTSSITGVDNTGAASYQPLSIGGSALDFSLSGSTAMTLNSTGLGVGVSPAQKLDIIGSLATRAATTGANQDVVSIRALNSDASAYANALYYANSQKWHYNGASLGMTLDTSGNVGIGVAPSAWTSFKVLEINGMGHVGSYTGGGISTQYGLNAYYGGSWKYQATGYASRYIQELGTHAWYTAPSGTAGNAITFTQAMTLDSGGNLLLNATSFSTNNGKLRIQHTGLAGEWAIQTKSNTTDGYAAVFYTTTGQAGFISVSGTSTTFSTSSDYRLKEAVQPIVGGLARVNALKPSIYKWKADGSNGEGFLAHELAEVVPLAVTGEKDAVNEDGSIKPQGVDLSKVVPVLVAAIQELTAEVNALKNA